ncbi:uracil-DNA glycosylase [Alteromonas facilis]|uniref:uracil-DNA glycosylase n=1 Tax=Alteromonas facilis TaxID=2048004 RepID=UPI000C2844C2|nr:uracil-DNA glycosylase [Alteromonas facilis]
MSLTWADVLGKEKQQPYFIQMMDTIAQIRRSGTVVYPPSDSVFNALALTPLENLKVVILGQDPYHGEGQAHGLCFSVPEGIRPPPSLKNIYKELDRDFPQFNIPSHGNLTAWAKQGVLLLNTVLTVEQGKAHSHAKLGWETFTDHVIEAISEHTDNVVFMLWGGHAQRKAKHVDASRHCILTAVHPSPLSAHRGFIGCGHFSKTNQWLAEHNKTPIEWQV